MTEQHVIDRAALAMLYEETGSDPDFIAELITTFFDDTSQLLVDLSNAIARSDAIETRRLAHVLKSNSASFGANPLADLCRELEARAARGELAGVEALRAQIETEYATVQRALQTIIDTGYKP